MRLRLEIVLVLLAASLFSCKNDPEPASNRTGPLSILVGTDVSTFDPQMLFEVDSSYVLGNIFDSLVEFDESFRLSPRLAKRWTNPDDHTWRFYLDENAFFSDGTALKASDVKFSIERLNTLENSDLRGFVEHIVQIQAINDYTIDIKTDRPFSILSNLVFIPVLSEKHVRSAGNDVSQKPLGTGPYKLESHQRNNKITLRLNEFYKPRPQIHQVEFLINSDVEKTLETVLQRKPDITLTLPFRKIEEFQKQKPSDLELLRSNGITVEYLMYNLKPSIPGYEKNPLVDIRLRKALAQAIDREDIVRTIFKGFGRSATQLIAPEVFGFDPTVRPPDFNPAEAKRSIQEGGYSGLELPIYTLQAGSHRFEKLLMQKWTDIGIRPSLRFWKDTNEMNKALNDGNYVLALAGYVCTSGDAGELLSFGLHTRSNEGTYGKGNYAYYSNAEVDRVTEENLHVLDAKSRLAMIQHVMRIVNADLPYLPLLVYDDVYIVSNAIRWVPPVSGDFKIRNITYR
jgi:peptide/nickel transport system substrate-binding protein